MSTGRPDGSARQRVLALESANHVRLTRATLKRRLRAGEVAAADTILRSSRDTDTMTVGELLVSQRGWGPKRSAKMLRSVSLSEEKTLGSLTERQRVMLAAVISSRENDGQVLFSSVRGPRSDRPRLRATRLRSPRTDSCITEEFACDVGCVTPRPRR
jgi:hypothetical protein